MTDKKPFRVYGPFDKVQPLSRMTYVASLPGNINVKPFVWLRGRSPRQYVPNLLFGILFLIVLLFVYPSAPTQAQGLSIVCGIMAPLSVLSVFNKLDVERFRCRSGSLCAAVLVSTNPPLVAVSTDLSKSSSESWPAIKILAQPLHSAKHITLQVGERVPAVSLYHSASGMAMSLKEQTGLSIGIPERPYWYDFSPVVVQCVTDDAAVIQDALHRLSESGDVWTELQLGLAQVPQPYQPGLYRLRQT